MLEKVIITAIVLMANFFIFLQYICEVVSACLLIKDKVTIYDLVDFYKDKYNRSLSHNRSKKLAQGQIICRLTNDRFVSVRTQFHILLFIQTKLRTTAQYKTA